MATFSKQDQNLNFQIPDNAEIFIGSGGPPYDEVWMRVGDKVVMVNFAEEGLRLGYTGEEARTQGREAAARALGYASWNEAQEKLPKRNLSDVAKALGNDNLAQAREVVSLQDFVTQAKNTPTGGGNVTVDEKGNTTIAQPTGQGSALGGANIGGGTATGQPVGQGQQFSPAQSAQVINSQTEENAQLDSLLAGSNLTPDQRDAIKAIFNTIAADDKERAQQLTAAFAAAAKINEPFFAQQVKLALDELQRGFVSIDQDLEFKEQSLRNRLTDLNADLASSREFMSLEHQQALKQLQGQYERTLDTTREDMARRGFTASSRRAEAETLLEEQTGELRESSQRLFGAKMLELQRAGERGDRDAQAELKRLQDLAGEQRTGLARQGEAALGSEKLGQLPVGTTPLGGLTGSIPREELQGNLTAAQQFVF